MKKKLFVVSDIHSYFSIVKKALEDKGFDENNENHWLIICGDHCRWIDNTIYNLVKEITGEE